LERRAT